MLSPTMKFILHNVRLQIKYLLEFMRSDLIFILHNVRLQINSLNFLILSSFLFILHNVRLQKKFFERSVNEYLDLYYTM